MAERGKGGKMVENKDRMAELMHLLDEHIKTIPRPSGDDPQGGDAGKEGKGGDGHHGKNCCCCCASINVVAIAAAIALAGKAAAASDCCCHCDKDRAYDNCIYVRGETMIWAWNHGNQQWRSYAFNEPIIDVKSGNHSLLAMSRTTAVVFDCLLGEFLTPLSASQSIEQGEIITF